jgi:hypothetical protein
VTTAFLDVHCYVHIDSRCRLATPKVEFTGTQSWLGRTTAAES